MFVYAIKKYKIPFHLPQASSLWYFLKENFFLVGNNISVHLQQSIFLFALSSTGNAMILGAYAFCDKIIWAFRLLLISFSSAVYPRSTILYHEEYSKWKSFKRNINLAFCVVFTFSAIVFLIAPSFIVTLFTGEESSLGVAYARTIAFVPLIIALNSLNLLELLIRNDYASIFRISLIILAFSALTSFLFLQLNNPLYFAYYPLVIESLCLILYLLYLRKNTDERVEPVV